MPPLYDVVCRVEIVLGTCTLKVRDCLNMERRSVIRLIQSAGDDLQVLVNGVPIAHGETVIVDDNTAVRITDILPPPGGEAPA